MTDIEIRQWNYPDTLEKQLMNQLIANGKISAKEYTTVTSDTDLQAGIIEALNDFETELYVTSAMVQDPPGSGPFYKVYTVTPFFNLILTQFRAALAEERRQRIELWEAQQAELPPEERFDYTVLS